MNFSVTQNGVPLNPSLYTWDEKTRTFSTNECQLVLDFRGQHGVTFELPNSGDCLFKTGDRCIFRTSDVCTFDTGGSCKFETGSHCSFFTSSSCAFITQYGCIFKTGENCKFITESTCTFSTDEECTFKTGDFCVFDCESGCEFDTGDGCNFDTGNECKFDTGTECTFEVGCDCIFDVGPGCVIVDRIASQVIYLNDVSNHYDMKKTVQYNFDDLCLTVFRNREDLGYSITGHGKNIEELKQILPKDMYDNLVRDMFEKLA